MHDLLQLIWKSSFKPHRWRRRWFQIFQYSVIFDYRKIWISEHQTLSLLWSIACTLFFFSYRSIFQAHESKKYVDNSVIIYSISRMFIKWCMLLWLVQLSYGLTMCPDECACNTDIKGRIQIICSKLFNGGLFQKGHLPAHISFSHNVFDRGS